MNSENEEKIRLLIAELKAMAGDEELIRELVLAEIKLKETVEIETLHNSPWRLGRVIKQLVTRLWWDSSLTKIRDKVMNLLNGMAKKSVGI